MDKLEQSDYHHCDTRDFAILSTNEDGTSDFDKRYAEYKSKFKMSNKYLFTCQDILDCLNTLEEHTGGKGHWRMLKIKTRFKGWAKYIRFVGVGYVDKYNGEEMITERMYVATTSEGNVVCQLSRKDLEPENIDTEYLNFIE